MKLRRIANMPHRAMGPKGSVHRLRGLMAGDHLTQVNHSGATDHKGYQGSTQRRNGKQSGQVPQADTRKRLGAEGNSTGSPAPGVGHGMGRRGSLESHSGHAGRGGVGRMGKSDAHKGAPAKLTENITHDAFEKLGSE